MNLIVKCYHALLFKDVQKFVLETIAKTEQKDAAHCQDLMCHLPPDQGRDRRTGPEYAGKHPSTVSRSCNHNINASSLDNRPDVL